MGVACRIAVAVVLAVATCAMAGAQPVAQWNETRHDFGLFHESEGNQVCRFVVTNTGDSELIITQVKTTCGCTVAQYTTDIILPGENGHVDVTYSPTGRPGPFSKTVWAYTNTSPNRTRLVIEGSVVGSAESVKRFYPVDAGDLQFTTLILPFGETKKGAMPSSSTTAYNTGNDTIVLSFDNNTSHITCNAVPDTIAPGSISTLSFFFNTLRTPVWGINDNYITVAATPLHSTKSPTEVKINLVANVVEDFSKLTSKELAEAPVCQVDESKVLIADIERGQSRCATVTVKNTGKSNLVIRRVMSTDKAVAASATKTLLKPGTTALIKINVYSMNVDGDILNTFITVISNDPVNPRITIPVVGNIIPVKS